ncbi:MAG: hypothetical protein DRR19_00510 [Candidatus Parabeggiatoa sp. nov. 1]|nr:MAG: hypothetical protein DRR19_00510 [Gammaproteobacteria bacterium]
MLRTTLQNESRGATINYFHTFSELLEGNPSRLPLLTAMNNLKSRIANDGLRISFKNSYNAQRFKMSSQGQP